MDSGKKGLPSGRNSMCRYVKVGTQEWSVHPECRCVGREWLEYLVGALMRGSRL